MQKVTTTIQTTSPTLSIYDLCRVASCDRTIVLEQIPLIYDLNVNSLHLPSCSNKQLVIPTLQGERQATTGIPVCNLDGFFRNLRGMFLTGYAEAPNLDLMLDYLEAWAELCVDATTLADVNLSSLHALKLVFGLNLGEITTDTKLAGEINTNAQDYASQLVSNFASDVFIYRSGDKCYNEMITVIEARQWGASMRYQLLDQSIAELDEFNQILDLRNTSCLEALAWIPQEKHAELFKATLYGE